MQLILNIGLDVTASAPIAAHVALEIVKANGFLVIRHKVVMSDTEPTLVVDAVWPYSWKIMGRLAGQAVHQSAIDLKQDCIAVWLPVQAQGRLIGPRAAAWGAFNPEFFILPNGKRLATPTINKAA